MKRLGFQKKEIDVWIQDQETPPFQYYLMREDKTDITLTAPIVKGDIVVSVSAGHGFTPVAGEYMVIMEGGLYIQTKVISVSVNDITLASKIGSPFTVNATIIRGNIEMNIDGSATPQDFVFNMRDSLIPIDIQHIHVTIHNVSTAGDDGLFGDLLALTNGLRFVKENDIDQGLGNYSNNSDFREFGAEVIYTDKAGGGGTYGVNISFDMKEVFGIVLRVDPRKPHIIKGTVQDALQTLKRVRVSLMGQYTQGE